MKLRDTVGVWFSELVDNWEKCDCHWFSWSRRKDGHYFRCGDLPDGRHFGAGAVPAFGDPWARESAIVIVGEDGELQQDTPSWIDKWNSRLMAVAASPSGRTLIWFASNNQLGVWTQRKEGFVDWDGECLNKRIGGRPIVDALMHEDGILEIRCEGGEILGYLCDADLVLEPWESGWTPKAEECRNLSYALENGFLPACPVSLFVRICEDDPDRSGNLFLPVIFPAPLFLRN